MKHYRYPTRSDIDHAKAEYHKGVRVVLVKMEDEQAPEPGTQGTVNHVDDIGTIFVDWDNGSKLGAVLGVDVIRII